MTSTPSIGALVHYTEDGTTAPAIITGVRPDGGVYLTVFPVGQMPLPVVDDLGLPITIYEAAQPVEGAWNWPLQVRTTEMVAMDEASLQTEIARRRAAQEFQPTIVAD
ncbi:hypothetical protein SEA_CLOWN_86 [Gordonia phage Clown]|uniref:Uncharacterized protein n=1 Tax=Gordonia phage Clown TaxID=2759393 RepID=A0A7L7SQ36_9CAUD|nr:hypothetical protein KNV25_gp86 [Gordonia phage Clown]QOC56084.1 hypothetical protein SEA_CLOWN_86 [Gordonia phage Clown]